MTKEIIDPPYESNPEHRWQALMRGQILSTTVQKFFNYVQLADNKAQGMILLNSILIPVALSWIAKEEFWIACLISICSAVLSILAAIICIYPKRRNGRKPDGSINLLHFGDIARLKEDEYLNEFQAVYNSTDKLAEAAIKDLHDVARRIIRPKFYWLKISYGVFFCGNLVAILYTLYSLALL